MLGHDGGPAGRLADLGADSADGRVTHLLVRLHRRIAVAPFDLVAVADDSLRLVAELPPAAAPEGLLLLGRHVLDVQVLDSEGRHVGRVGDVELHRDQAGLRAVSVDLGSAAVLRRLGLRRLGLGSHRRVEWSRLQPPERPGRPFRLAAEQVRRRRRRYPFRFRRRRARP